MSSYQSQMNIFQELLEECPHLFPASYSSTCYTTNEDKEKTPEKITAKAKKERHEGKKNAIGMCFLTRFQQKNFKGFSNNQIIFKTFLYKI